MDIDKMYHKECAWNDIFNIDERETVQEGFLLTGFISVVLGLWLNFALFTSNLKLDRSYNNLANFTLTSCVRRVIPVFSQLTFIKYMESWQGFQNFKCDFFGFWETFLAVLEMECLTHVCIERYVLAKYNTNGWPMQKRHYTLYLCLCFFFSTLYSLPPLFGIGQYGNDFTCTSCTFDMILLNNWKRGLVIIIFLLRSVKPAVVMSMMLIWCRSLEKKYKHKSHLNEINFTRNTISITCLNMLCWTPIAIIRACVVMSQLFNSGEVWKPAASYVKWAMWLHWVSPALTVINLFLVDEQIRETMFSLCAPNNSTEEDKDKDD